MPHYLYQWTYTNISMKAMVGSPHDRSTELKKAIEGFGGRMHNFFYAFGEYDGLAVVEFPDNESCTACSLMLGAHGGASAFKTTPLISSEEGWRAMRKANEKETGYLAPAGYSSFG